MAELPFRELIVKSGVNELFVDAKCDDERVICWSRLAADGGAWIINVSNGNDIWRTNLERQDLETLCEISGIATSDEYFEIIKNCFENETISMVKVGNKIVLQCPGRKATVNFDLYESKMNDRKAELHHILFHLTDKINSLKRSLVDVNEALEGERRKGKDRGSGLENQSFGFEPTRKSGQGANVRRKHGHSLVNPNSKKTKRAKGISFE